MVGAPGPGGREGAVASPRPEEQSRRRAPPGGRGAFGAHDDGGAGEMRLGRGRLRSGLRAGGERGAGGEEAAGASAQAGEAERAAAEPGGQRGHRPAPAAAAAAATRRAAPRRGLQPVGSAEPPGRRRLGEPGARAGVGRRGRRQRRLQPRVLGDLLPAQPGALPALQPGAAPRGALRLLQAGGWLLRRGRRRAGARGRGDAAGGSCRAALAAPHAVG